MRPLARTRGPLLAEGAARGNAAGGSGVRTMQRALVCMASAFALGCGGKASSLADDANDAALQSEHADASVDVSSSDAGDTDATQEDSVLLFPDALRDDAPDFGGPETDARSCPGPPLPMICGRADAAICGPMRLCKITDPNCHSPICATCCGGTGACCSSSSDCCSVAAKACVGGLCSSIGNSCSSDADCGELAACFAGACLIPPGALCAADAECSSGQCTGTCALGTTTSAGGGPPCRSVADCSNGNCTDSHCLRGREGALCQSELDCANGACMAGTCHCLPPGAPALTDVENNGCCSDDVFGQECVTGSKTVCLTDADCLGGPCASSPSCAGKCCSCTGAGGECSTDSDCCAGATRCVSSFCQ